MRAKKIKSAVIKSVIDPMISDITSTTHVDPTGSGDMSDIFSTITSRIMEPVHPLREAANRLVEKAKREQSEFASIEELRGQLGNTPSTTDEYKAKMMHPVPAFDEVRRLDYIIMKSTGVRVLNLGCASGDLHESIRAVAKSLVGVDTEVGTNLPEYLRCDLDEHPEDLDDVNYPYDLVVAGEILEHLGNPGNLLKQLRKMEGHDLLITVPNAFSSISRNHMTRGIENVNKEHVAWYSYTTLKTLLERYKYTIVECHWYNGQPRFAEGLIVLAR